MGPQLFLARFSLQLLYSVSQMVWHGFIFSGLEFGATFHLADWPAAKLEVLFILGMFELRIEFFLRRNGHAPEFT